MIAASRIAVPVADSQLKANTAASGVAFPTTGGTRDTSLSRPGIGRLGAERRLRNAFTCGVPHANTITTRKIHGMIAVRNGGIFFSAGLISSSSGATPRRAALFPVAIRYHAKHIIEQADAMMSTSHGPWKFETRYCGTANDTPATSSGAHNSLTPHNP